MKRSCALVLAVALVSGGGCSSPQGKDAFCGEAKQILKPEAMSKALQSPTGFEGIVAALRALDTSGLDERAKRLFDIAVDRFELDLVEFRKSRHGGLTVERIADEVNEICGSDIPPWSVVA